MKYLEIHLSEDEYFPYANIAIGEQRVFIPTVRKGDDWFVARFPLKEIIELKLSSYFVMECEKRKYEDSALNVRTNQFDYIEEGNVHTIDAPLYSFPIYEGKLSEILRRKIHIAFLSLIYFHFKEDLPKLVLEWHTKGGESHELVLHYGGPYPEEKILEIEEEIEDLERSLPEDLRVMRKWIGY